MERHLRRPGLLRTIEDEVEECGEGDPEGNLAASAVSGQAPPAPCACAWVSRTSSTAYRTHGSGIDGVGRAAWASVEAGF
jgi:hypothetical protein